MPTAEILNSHPISTLKKEISKVNIRGYSKMKKPELVKLMLKNKEKFSHIKMKTKGQKEPVKKIIKVKKEKSVPKPKPATPKPATPKKAPAKKAPPKKKEPPKPKVKKPTKKEQQTKQVGDFLSGLEMGGSAIAKKVEKTSPRLTDIAQRNFKKFDRKKFEEEEFQYKLGERKRFGYEIDENMIKILRRNAKKRAEEEFLNLLQKSKQEQSALNKPKGDRFHELYIGVGQKATPMRAFFNPKTKKLRFDPTTHDFHTGEKITGTDKTVRHNGRDMIETDMEKHFEDDRLVGGYGYSVGLLGEGAEDHTGSNIVPALKNQGHRFYGIHGRPNQYTKKFIRGYEKGGRAY